jgi:hypothetical protein
LEKGNSFSLCFKIWGVTSGHKGRRPAVWHGDWQDWTNRVYVLVAGSEDWTIGSVAMMLQYISEMLVWSYYTF